MNAIRKATTTGHDALLATVYAAHNLTENHETYHPPEASDPATIAQQVKTLAQALDRGTCKLILLLPEFDRHKAWAQDGQHSCVAWLNAYCGMSPSSAHDRRRVAYALEELPVVCQLFQLGELSWSKVRALTRVATPDNERELASQALMMSASAIEQVARQYRHVSTGAQLAEEDARAARQYDERRVNYRFDERGMVTIQASLPPLEGAAVLNSLARAEDKLFTEAHGNPREDNTHTIPHGLNREGAIGRTASQLKADAFSLMAMKHLAAEDVNIRIADRYQVVVHVDADVLAQKSGTSSSTHKCHIENGPALAASTVRRLADDCSVLPVFMKHGEPLSIGRKSRIWTNPIIRAITTRDQHYHYPGCTASCHTHVHHIKHWANGGDTSVCNGVLLCGFHHRLVHEKQYIVEKTPLDHNGKLP
ncbi:MAG: hypothetical protein ACI9US_003389 [Gammaproteobacteria bacterium]|jgi:hypothetical protein